MKQLLVIALSMLVLNACKKKKSNTDTTPVVFNGNTVNVIDNGTTYTDTGSAAAIACSIKKTSQCSFFNLKITATALFPISIGIAGAAGPVNSLGGYKIVPMDSSATFLSKNNNSFTEIFSGGENFRVDSVIINIDSAFNTRIHGTYQMWLENLSGTKTVFGNIDCKKGTIN